MNKLKNKILLLCGKCKRVVLVERSKWDLKDAVFIKSDCHRCDNSDTQIEPEYYNENGLMDYGGIESEVAE